jgi:UDP-2,3-diacylglucosamine hydrolase
MTPEPGRIFVIGDSHIGLAEGNERPILAWLERLAALKPRALYLNGDVFHYFIADRKFYTPSVEKVFARLRELRDSGIAIHYVEGNRDFFLKGSFAEKAVTDVGLEYAIVTPGKKYLIVHGDMINERDLPYRFWRRVSKNPFSKLALKFVPKKTARKFVDSVEKRLSDTNFKHKSKLPTELMEAYGRRRKAKDGFDVVVFGHFHHKTELDAGGSRVTVLPAWYESGEAMMIDPDTGTYEFVTI